MKTFKALLAASALIALSATASLAGGVGDNSQYGAWNDSSSSSSSGSNIINGQVNLQNNWSNLTGSIDTTGSDATAMGAAAGNLIDITTMNNTKVQNSQVVGSGASIGSNVNVDMNSVWGNATVANQVLCNGASVSTDPTYAATNNYQKCSAADPFSGITTNISNVAGNAIVQGSSLGNSFEADSNAPNMPIVSRQINNSGVTSNINANLYNVGGTATLSSSAIGNTSQIIHYSTN